MTYFRWTPEAVATLRRLYRDPSMSCDAIAARIGNGCKARAVVRKAAREKLVSPRRHKPGPRNLSVVRIDRVPEGKRRYVGWFLTARWSPHEVARLFDLRGEQISA